MTDNVVDLIAALRALLNSAELNQDDLEPETGEAIDHAYDVLSGVPKSGDPLPVRAYTVSGTVHLAGGFEVVVSATDRAAARNAAIALVEEWRRDDLIDRCGVELQEVCPDHVEESE